jgi:hypothetical protein
MSDETDLQAIAHLLGKQKQEMLEESAKQAAVIMESYFDPKFNLLAAKDRYAAPPLRQG